MGKQSGALREGFESRSATARGGVAQISSKKLCVTGSRPLRSNKNADAKASAFLLLTK